MKTFKVIISLIALIAVGTASAAQQSKKLTNDEKLNLLTALKKEKEFTQQVSKGKELTQAQAREYQQQELLINKYQQTKDQYVTQQIEKNKTEIQRTIPQASQAMTSIANQIKALPVIKYDKPVALTQQASIMKDLENSKDWTDFIATTESHDKIIYNNGELQQAWFNLAADMAKKFNQNLTIEQLTDELRDAASSILMSYTDEETLTTDDINGRIDVAIHDYLPTKGTYKPATQPKFSPSLVGESIKPSPLSKLSAESVRKPVLKKQPISSQQPTSSPSLIGSKSLLQPSQPTTEKVKQPIIATSQQQPTSKKTQPKPNEMALTQLADNIDKQIYKTTDDFLNDTVKINNGAALYYQKEFQPQWFSLAAELYTKLLFNTNINIKARMNLFTNGTFKTIVNRDSTIEEANEIEQLVTNALSQFPQQTSQPLQEVTPEKALAMLSTGTFKSMQDFINETVGLPNAFVYQNQFNPLWFELAVKIGNSLGFKDQKLKEAVIVAANKLYSLHKKGGSYSDQIRNEINQLVDNAIAKIIKETPKSIQPTTSTPKTEFTIGKDMPKTLTTQQEIDDTVFFQTLMSNLALSPSWDKFFAITEKYSQVFYKDGKLQQDWFTLAVKKIYELETKGKNTPNAWNVYNFLQPQAYKLLAKALGKNSTTLLNSQEKGDVEPCLRKAFDQNQKELS